MLQDMNKCWVAVALVLLLLGLSLTKSTSAKPRIFETAPPSPETEQPERPVNPRQVHTKHPIGKGGAGSGGQPVTLGTDDGRGGHGGTIGGARPFW
ncbi:hypothetical protein CYMTET_19971, partial [Cymbomonas tetramitiformis]